MWGKVERVAAVHLGEEKAQGNLVSRYKYLKGGCKEDRARFFSVVASERTRGNGHKLRHGMIHLNLRKYFFTVRMVEHWHRLLLAVMKSLSLEIHSKAFWTCLEKLALGDCV